MSPPPAARGRTALGRLVDALRRRLTQDPGAPPARREPTREGAGAGTSPTAELAAAGEPAETVPVPADADARFDAARDRLRARIEPPAPDGD